MAKLAHYVEVKGSLMNRKPYLRDLTVTIQGRLCEPAINPVGLFRVTNDEKVTSTPLGFCVAQKDFSNEPGFRSLLLSCVPLMPVELHDLFCDIRHKQLMTNAI